MKRILLLAATLMQVSAASAQTNNPSPYCVSQFDNNYNMIQSVSVNGTSFGTGPAGNWGSTNSYTFFNNAVFPSLVVNNSATIAISFYSVTDWEPRYFGVWIDYNNNTTFDASELIMNNAMTTNTDLPTGGGSPVSISMVITVPGTAVSGNRRMRVVRSQNPVGSPYANYSPTVQVLACNPVASDQAYGCSYDFNVNIISGPPVANFSVSTGTACTGQTISLTDLSTNSPSNWTCTATGAVNPMSTVQNPTLSFSSAGTYTINFVCANAAGVSASVSKTIAVVATPQLSMTPATNSICAKNSMTIIASGADTYSWSTGATTRSIVVSPTTKTTYSVTGTNSAVCSSMAAKTISVNTCNGISENTIENAIVVYPNPGNGMVHIVINESTFQQGIIRITNLYGQLIREISADKENDLDLREVSPGTYYIVYSCTGGFSAVTKYVRE